MTHHGWICVRCHRYQRLPLVIWSYPQHPPWCHSLWIKVAVNLQFQYPHQPPTPRTINRDQNSNTPQVHYSPLHAHSWRHRPPYGGNLLQQDQAPQPLALQTNDDVLSHLCMSTLAEIQLGMVICREYTQVTSPWSLLTNLFISCAIFGRGGDLGHSQVGLI